MCCPEAYLEPLFPLERIIVGEVETSTQGPISHVVIEKDHLTLIDAVSNERDKVDMAKLGKHPDLNLKLSRTLLRLGVQALDCHSQCTLVKETLIYIAKTTLADN